VFVGDTVIGATSIVYNLAKLVNYMHWLLASSDVFITFPVFQSTEVDVFASTFRFFQSTEIEEEHVDDRSVDELLSFINGGGTGNGNFSFSFFFPFSSA